MTKFLMLAGASALALTCPAMASAQAATQATPAGADAPQSVPAATASLPEEPQAATTGVAQATAPADGLGGEVVVTAQRREERLRDVPIAITAVSAAQIASAGITGTQDLGQLTPGLTIASSGAFAQPTIRGIGTTATGAGTDANVAIYVDGVYMATQAANFFDFNNIEQIEVLKGPQGTLFGRNATGGAITITTRKPSQDFHADAAVSYGSFREINGGAYVTGGLANGIAADLAVQYRNNNGYARDIVLNTPLAKTEQFSVRGKLLLEPTSNLSLTLAADYLSRNDTAAYTLKALNGNTTARASNVVGDTYEFALSFTPKNNVRAFGTSARALWTLDFGTVTAISSYRNVRSVALTDLDRTPASTSFTSFEPRQRTFTNELNFASADFGIFSAIGGVYFYNDRAQNLNLITNGTRGAVATVTSNSVSGYFEGTARFADWFKLIAGVRYSTERRGLDSTRPSDNARIVSSRRYSAWTPRVSALVTLTPDLNAYATFSQGFKSGTYNASTFADAPVAPESVDAYEAGLKFARRGMSINASVFHYDYTDIQISSINIQTGLTNLYNAASAKISGADLEFSFAITPKYIFRGGVAYTDAKYTDFPNALFFNPRTTGGNTQVIADASGKKMVRTPPITVNLSNDYRTDFAGGELHLNGSVFFNGGYFWTVDNRLRQQPYAVVNASIGWSPAHSPVTVTLWARNLFDERYSFYVSQSATSDGIAYDRPRSIGGTLAVRL